MAKLVKTKDSKSKLDKLIKSYDLKLAENTSTCCIIEICADRAKIEEILKKLKAFQVKQLVRTGRIAISK